MIKPIMTNQLFLARPSEPAGPSDAPTAQDLLDTLAAHSHECVGMAANMIGMLKRIIAFDDEGTYRIMYNPEIVSRAGEYAADEGCLSLAGRRPVTRYRTIKVRYQDAEFREKTKTYTGWTAQIIQHEIDHCDGIVV